MVLWRKFLSPQAANRNLVEKLPFSNVNRAARLPLVEVRDYNNREEAVMFGMDRSKTQGDDIPSAPTLGENVIISPDTIRANRIPPGQSRTKKWPVLDASGAPHVDLALWRFRITGMVGKEVQWTWEEF